ncbi:hypothetical protein GGF37_004017 [Kickxella alabastrina]|nr:hypothetical protein GGF37_004017 [Kickxella alabastrina]
MHFSTTLAAVSALIASSAGHSLLSTPATRGNTKWFGTCAAGAGCKGPCDSPKADSPFNSNYVPKTYIQRGQELDVEWKRLNHPGGFVRLAMVPFDQSDSWSAFNSNVLEYTCYETNCGPTDPSNTMFGHLNGPGSAPCSTKVIVPKNIPDGTAVTLQWVWYGGGIYYGETDTSFGEYYSCSDLIVSGGPLSDEKPEAVFKGGDITYPNSGVCKYWGSNKVGDCNFGDRVPSPIDGDLLSQSLEPCIRGPELKGAPYGFAVGTNNTDSAIQPVPHSAVVASSAAPETPAQSETYSPVTSEVVTSTPEAPIQSDIYSSSSSSVESEAVVPAPTSVEVPAPVYTVPAVIPAPVYTTPAEAAPATTTSTAEAAPVYTSVTTPAPAPAYSAVEPAPITTTEYKCRPRYSSLF